MHAIQTSGNCVRNITSDHFAGVARDEIVDPRPYCEIIRQWATLHPEFAYLPRKFKIAVTGATNDRAAVLAARHRARARQERRRRDRLSRARRRRHGPHADHRPCDPRVPAARGDPQLPRRDPARVQPVRPSRQQVQGAHQDPGEGAHAAAVRARRRGRVVASARRRRRPCPTRSSSGSTRISPPPPYEALAGDDSGYKAAVADNRAFGNWVKRNVHPHKVPGYAIVTLSLKTPGVPPGDATSDQMDAIADLADRYSLRRGARLARAEPDPARRAPGGPVRRVDAAEAARPRDAEHRPADRHHLLPGRRLLLARQREVDPDRRSDPRAASTTSTTCTTSARSTSTSPAA